MSIQGQFPGDLLQPCVALHIMFFSLTQAEGGCCSPALCQLTQRCPYMDFHGHRISLAGTWLPWHVLDITFNLGQFQGNASHLTM